MNRRNNTPMSLARNALLAAGLTTAVSAAKETHAAASDIAASTAIDIETALGISVEQPEGADHQWGFAYNPNTDVIVTTVDTNSDTYYYPDEIRVSDDAGATWNNVSVDGQTDLEVIGQSVSGTTLTVLFRDTSNGRLISGDFGTGGVVSNEVNFGYSVNTNGGGLDPLTQEAYGSKENSSGVFSGHSYGTPSSPSAPSEVYVADSNGFSHFTGESQPAVGFYNDYSGNDLKFVSDPFGTPTEYSTGVDAVTHGVLPASLVDLAPYKTITAQDLYLFQDPTDYSFKAYADPASSAPVANSNEAPTASLFDADGNAILDGGSFDVDINEDFTVQLDCVDSISDDEVDGGALTARVEAWFYPGGTQVMLTSATPTSGGTTVSTAYSSEKFDEPGRVEVSYTCSDGIEDVEGDADGYVDYPVSDGTLTEGHEYDFQGAILGVGTEGASASGTRVTVAPAEDGDFLTLDDFQAAIAEFIVQEGGTVEFTTSGTSLDAQVTVAGISAGAAPEGTPAPPSADGFTLDVSVQVDEGGTARMKVTDVDGTVLFDDVVTGEFDFSTADAGGDDGGETGGDDGGSGSEGTGEGGGEGSGDEGGDVPGGDDGVEGGSGSGSAGGTEQPSGGCSVAPGTPASAIALLGTLIALARRRRQS